jgi:hypothetical protein
MSFEIVSSTSQPTLDLSNPSTLRGAGNITLSCGLVQEAPSDGHNLQGQAGRQVFVFDRRNGELLHAFDPAERLTLMESLQVWLGGTGRRRILMVSALSHRVVFQTTLHLANTTLERVCITLGVIAVDARELATKVQQNADPVLGLCESLRAQLARQVHILRLEDIQSMAPLRNRVFALLESLPVDSRYVRVDHRDIHIDPPRQILDRDRARLEEEAKIAEERARIAILYEELNQAGITDPHIRLLLADPNTRHDYLKGLFEQKLGQIQSASARHDRVFTAKQERIAAFIKDRVTDQTTAQELREMLQLLDEANAPASAGGTQFEILSPQPALPPSASARPSAAGTRFQVIGGPLPTTSSPTNVTTQDSSAGFAPSPTDLPESRAPRFKPNVQELPEDEDAL